MVAFDPAGNLAVGGAHQQREGMVTKLSSEGQPLWTMTPKANGLMDMAAIAADPSGNFYVAGSFERAFDVAGTSLEGGERPSIFVVKLTPTGSVAWAKAFGGSGYNAARAVATDRDGNLYLTGTYQRELSFGGPPLQAYAFRDVFVASLDTNGNHRWSLGFMAQGPVETTGTAISVDDKWVYVAGLVESDFGFASAREVQSLPESLFVVALSKTGTPVFRHIYSGTDKARATGIASDGVHGVTVVSEFSGTMKIDGTELRSAGKSDALVMHMDAGGATQWTKRFGGNEYDRATGVILDSGGNSVVAAVVVDDIDLGTPNIGYGRQDALVASFDPTGTLQWMRRYGTEQNEEALAVARSPAGALAVAGSFASTIDPGFGVVEGPAKTNGFIFRFGNGQPPELPQRKVGIAADPAKAEEQAAFAAERCDLETLKRLVPSSVNAASANGHWTLVMIAAYHGKGACVRYLLANGADANAAPGMNYTPLMQAVRFGYVDAAKALVDGGARVDLVDAKNGTALHVALDEAKLSPETARFLIDAKTPLEAKDGRGRTPLLVALDARNSDGVRMLLDAKADVNAADGRGYSAVARAATADDEHEVAEFLQRGAKPDEPSDTGWTPLTAAAHNGNIAIVNLLLSKGARASGPPMSKPVTSPLMVAAMGGYGAVIDALLAKGARPNDKDAQGETAAHFAAMNGHTDVLRALKKHGANFAIKDKKGRSVVDVARHGETADYATGRTK
jgi:ankyrin repeat protein